MSRGDIDMISKKHKIFNFILIVIPWLSVLFLDKPTIKRYSVSSVLIAIYETISHIYGKKKKYWKFYDKRRSFIRDEFPFDIGPYVPISMWILKYTYGNFKKFVLVNVIFNAFFAFIFIPVLEKLKILRLNRLNHLQFFIYIHYKAYLLYGVQYLYDKLKGRISLNF